MTSVRCHHCLYSFHGETVAVRDRYLAHIPVCPVIAATTTPTSLQAASFLRHPAQSQRGDIAPATTGEQVAASGAPTGDGGGASSGVSSPDAAPIRPLFKWIGERNTRPLRWWL